MILVSRPALCGANQGSVWVDFANVPFRCFPAWHLIQNRRYHQVAVPITDSRTRQGDTTLDTLA